MTTHASALNMLDKPVANYAPKKQNVSREAAPAESRAGQSSAGDAQQAQDAKDFKKAMAKAAQKNSQSDEANKDNKNASSEKAAAAGDASAEVGRSEVELAQAPSLPSELPPLEQTSFLAEGELKPLTPQVQAEGLKPQALLSSTQEEPEAGVGIGSNAVLDLQKVDLPLQAKLAESPASAGKAEALASTPIKGFTLKNATPEVSVSSDDDLNSASVPTATLSKSGFSVAAPQGGGNLLSSMNSGQLTQALSNKFMAQGSGVIATKAGASETLMADKGFSIQQNYSLQEEQDFKPALPATELPPKTPLPAADRVFVSANVRFGSPAWAGQIAERSANLASQNIKQAEIQLNPQDMGPINVKISMANEQATVTFSAQNAAVREALDATLQRLKESFDEEGLDLVQADVTDHQASDGDDSQAYGGEPQGGSEEAQPEQHVVHVPRSAVDHFV